MIVVDVGQRFAVNGTTYEVETLAGPDPHYPILLLPVERPPGWAEDLERFISANRFNPDTAAEHRARANGPMAVELAWFRRPDVRQVANG